MVVRGGTVDNITNMFVLYIDGWIVLCFFLYIKKVKKLIGFQLGMNISVVMGGMGALLSGVMLLQQFPFHYTVITFVATLAGMAVGGLFGILFDYQTFVTGLTNAAFMGLMSTMIGTVIEMPILFILFLHGIFFLCLVTISLSIYRA